MLHVFANIFKLKESKMLLFGKEISSKYSNCRTYHKMSSPSKKYYYNPVKKWYIMILVMICRCNCTTALRQPNFSKFKEFPNDESVTKPFQGAEMENRKKNSIRSFTEKKKSYGFSSTPNCLSNYKYVCKVI